LEKSVFYFTAGSKWLLKRLKREENIVRKMQFSDRAKLRFKGSNIETLKRHQGLPQK